jgi:phage terminase small subunit
MLPSDEGSVVEGRAGLSKLQREFATHFVLTGGKPRRAAILAGYSPSSSSISAHRNLVNPRVLAEIDRLCKSNIKAALPVAIRTLISVCISSKDDRARVQAASKLVELGGMVPKGPGVQVNVGVQVNGQQAQALIGEVWKARERRMSSIEGGMPDSPPTLDGVAEPAALPAPTDREGGDVFQGPVRVPCPIPPPSPTPNPSSPEPRPQSEAAAVWRRATSERSSDARADE